MAHLAEHGTRNAEHGTLRRSGLLRILAAELLDAPCGIDELLLAAEERMAAGADLHVDRLAGRAGVVDRPARATDRAFDVLGMNAVFHFSSLIITGSTPLGFIRHRGEKLLVGFRL